MQDLFLKYDFGFKKKFGQNFITDGNLLRAIVEDAGAEGRRVLEIGAGAGALTRALAERAEKVLAFEIDPSLRPILAETLAGIGNAEVVFRDFMKCDLKEVEKELGVYRVVANLPYYITTPVVMRFVEEAEGCESLTVMVQEEVAARFAAKAGTAEYGAVTAAIALFGSCEQVRKVPRTMFYPRPNVDSAVIRIDRKKTFDVKSRTAYRAAVRAAFSGRRKTLENNIMATFRLTREEARDVLKKADVPDGARGETLSPERFAVLADVLFENGIVK